MKSVMFSSNTTEKDVFRYAETYHFSAMIVFGLFKHLMAVSRGLENRVGD